MNEDSFTSSGVSTAESYPGAPHQSPLKEKAGQTAQSFQSEADRIKGTAKEQTAAAVEQVKAGVQSATHQAQQAGRTFIRQQQDTLASRCSQYASAARSASQCLNTGETNVLAAPASMVADKLEQFSGYLKREPTELLGDLESFARRRPEVVFGGLFVLGLAAARFLKASRRDLEEREFQRTRAYRSESMAPSSYDYDHGMETAGTSYSGGMQTGSSIPSSSGVGSTSVGSGSTSVDYGTTPSTTTPPWSTNIVTESETTPLSDSDCGCSTTPESTIPRSPLP